MPKCHVAVVTAHEGPGSLGRGLRFLVILMNSLSRRKSAVSELADTLLVLLLLLLLLLPSAVRDRSLHPPFAYIQYIFINK